MRISEFKRWLETVHGVSVVDGSRHCQLYLDDRQTVPPRHPGKELKEVARHVVLRQLGIKWKSEPVLSVVKVKCMLKFPALFELAPSGGFVVTFRDNMPDAITQRDSLDDAETMAIDALVTALDFHFEDKREVPRASPLQGGNVSYSARRPSHPKSNG